MRIELDKALKRNLKIFYACSFVFSAVMIPVDIAISKSRGEPESYFYLIYLIPVFISIILYVFVYAEYEVDQFSITRYGCFGKLKLGSMSWDQVGFVGSATIRTTFVYHWPEKLIYCAKNPPKREYTNSQYFVQPKGKHYRFHYSDSIRKILEEYSPNGFVELQ